MSIVKKRLSPEESRSAALEAARHILIEMGPAAVTLKARVQTIQTKPPHEANDNRSLIRRGITVHPQ